MEIPTYTNDVGASAAPIQGQVEVHDNLAGVVAGLNSINDVQNEKNKQAKEARSYQIRTDAQTQIEALAEQQKTAIDNGMDPAKAMQTYQTEYQKIQDANVGQLTDDADRSLYYAHTQRSGVMGQVGIQQAINSKNNQIKADTVNNRVDFLTSQLSKTAPADQPAIASQLSQSVGDAVNSGIISHEKGQMIIRDSVSKGLAQSASMIGNQDPAAGLAYINSHKDSIDGEQFAQLHNKFSDDVARIKTTADSVANVTNFAQDPYNNPRPKPDDVNVVYGQILQNAQAQKLPQAQVELQTINLAQTTGVTPPALRDQASYYLSMDPDTASKSDIATIASNARMVTAIGARDETLSGSQGFSKEAYFKANAIVSRMNAGMDETTAVRQVSAITSNQNTADLYNQYEKEAREQIAKSKFSLSGQGGFGSLVRSITGNGEANISTTDYPPDAQAMAADTFAQARLGGMPPDQAMGEAQKQVNSVYQKFNGEMVSHPPSYFDPRFSDQTWADAAQEKYKEVIGHDAPAGAKLLVSGDRQTMLEKNAGVSTNDLTYPIFLQRGEGLSAIRFPVPDKDGNPIRVKTQAGFKELPAKTGPILPGGYQYNDQ